MFASAVAFLAFSVQPVLPYVDADSVGEALGMVALEIRIVDGVRQYCAQEVPSAKGVFDHYTLLWEKQDEDEILAVETILDRRSDRARFESMRDAALSSAMTVSRAAAAVVGAENYCGGFFEAIKSGNRNVAHQTPKASGFLKTYMRENPPVAEKVQWRNDFMGCKIKLSNNGTDRYGAQDLHLRHRHGARKGLGGRARRDRTRRSSARRHGSAAIHVAYRARSGGLRRGVAVALSATAARRHVGAALANSRC